MERKRVSIICRKIGTLSLPSIIGIILVESFISQGYAAQMTVFPNPERDKASALFTGIRFITLKYEPGSVLSNIFDGKSERITFTMNASKEDGMRELTSTINQYILKEKESPVQIENASLDYTGSIRGEPDRASLAYKVVFKPTVSRFVLEKGGEQGSVVDLDWRGLIINQPLVVDTPKYGKVSVNWPIGLLQATHPDLAEKFLRSEVADIMKDPIFNFGDIGTPMERWHFLFDPAASQAGATSTGYVEESGANVVSVYSLGESSFREGALTAKELDATATIDGTKVSVSSSSPPPSAQIQIAGFSRIQKAGNDELAFITAQAPAGTVTATGGFPIHVLLVLSGMMGAVAIFVLVKARK
jgi:hypothetical protein